MVTLAWNSPLLYGWRRGGVAVDNVDILGFGDVENLDVMEHIACLAINAHRERLLTFLGRGCHLRLLHRCLRSVFLFQAGKDIQAASLRGRNRLPSWESQAPQVVSKPC